MSALDTIPAENPTAEMPVAEIVLAELAPVEAPRGIRRLARGAYWTCEQIIGLAALVAGLAFLAAIPGLQFISLGYLLEASGRMVRERRWSAGLIGFSPAARLGTIALATWLLSLPLRVIAGQVAGARLIDPGGKAEQGWSIALIVATVVIALHLTSAVLRGGRLRHFVWPAPWRTLKVFASFATFGQSYRAARDAVWTQWTSMRLGTFWWLGLRGYLLGLVWLIVPVTLLAAGRRTPVLGFLGAALLMFVAAYLPFLQTRFAATNQWRAMFDLRSVRRSFRHAPWWHVVALLATLALSLPLFLLKVELLPREAAAFPSLFFVAFNLPARWLAGGAVSAASRRPQPRGQLACWTARALMLPISAAYVLFVYLSQYTSWYGIGSLYEQHAFLLPVPFLGY